MGLIFSDACNLIEARYGSIGGRAVTLGRLTTYFHASDLNALRRRLAGDPEVVSWLDTYRWGEPADRFFIAVLKFSEVESLDFSEYQGATIIHDLSTALPEELHQQFDLVVDGGTLEHVFNYPVALGNLMQMAKVGGLVYSNTPCNNLMGHGFYQFSPELMYRVFTAANGFEVVFVRLAETSSHAVEITTGHRIYEVVDPDLVRRRVNLVTSRPVLMMTLARRTAPIKPFAEPVLQSDYVSRWREESDRASPGVGWKERLRRHVPKSVWNWGRRQALRRDASLSNVRLFKRIR